MSEIKYIVIPDCVLNDDKLSANAKILYGHIRSLCTDKGYCWASNKYLAQLMNVTTQSISTMYRDLKDRGYIEVEYKYREGTKEILYRYTKILDEVYKETFKGIKENLKENNINRINKYININNFKKIFNTSDTLPTYDTSKNILMSQEEADEILALMGKGKHANKNQQI